jgi:hypothetical protein
MKSMHWAPITVVAVLWLTIILSGANLSKGNGTITKAGLTGSWAMTLTGDTGCGRSASYITFTLNGAGSGPAAITSHTSGCGNLMRSGQAFAVSSLNPNGSGTANLSCGPGCECKFDIQVSPDRSMFSVVDVSPANPGNFLEGVAIRQFLQ